MPRFFPRIELYFGWKIEWNQWLFLCQPELGSVRFTFNNSFMRKMTQVNSRPYRVLHKESLECAALKASTSGLLSMLYQLPSPFIRQFNKTWTSTLSKLATSISSYSLDTSHPSVPSIFIVGMNTKLPNFNTIAIILNMLAISSLVKPMICSDFCEEYNMRLHFLLVLANANIIYT